MVVDEEVSHEGRHGSSSLTILRAWHSRDELFLFDPQEKPEATEDAYWFCGCPVDAHVVDIEAGRSKWISARFFK